jgi:hypothetical protein
MTEYISQLAKAKQQTQMNIDKETNERKKRLLYRKLESISKMEMDISNGEIPTYQSGFLSTTRGKVQLG